MILLSSRKLEHALADELLQPWEKVKYLIIPAVLACFSGPHYVIRPLYGSQVPATDFHVSSICVFLSAFLTYRGIKRCFAANQNIDGKTFFERFAVLVVPPLIRIMVVVFILSLGLIWSAYALKDFVPLLFKHASIITALIGPTVTYIIYLMVENSFHRLGELIAQKELSGS